MELESQSIKMPLLNIYELDVSTEFRDFLTEIKKNVEAYCEAKHKAQKERTTA